MLKYYIDNQLVSPPFEREDDGETIFFDNDLKGRITTNSQDSLKFYKEGFEILLNLYCEGLCQTVDYRIVECCNGIDEEIDSGFIRLSESKLNLEECYAEVTIVSGDFFYKIDANKSDKIRPSFTESANGTDILTPEKYKIFSIDQTRTRTAYLLKDVFEHALQYVTDGEIALQTGGILDDPACQWIVVTNGAKLSNNPSGEPIEYSFQELLDCIIKFKGAAWTIKDSEFILKSYCDLFVCGEELPFEDLKVISIEADQDNLFSRVRLGNNFKDFDDGKETLCDGTSVGDLAFRNASSGLPTWGETSLAIPYDCVTDNELDLSCEAIVDHNNIENSYFRCSEENASNIFFIDTVPFDLSQNLLEFKETSIEGSSDLYYNEFFLNANVLERNECYLRSIGIPYDALFPVVSRCWIQNNPPPLLSSGELGPIRKLVFGSLSYLGNHFSLLTNLTNQTQVQAILGGPATSILQFLTNDPNLYTQDLLIPGEGNTAWVFTPPFTGCYRFCLDLSYIMSGWEIINNGSTQLSEGSVRANFIIQDYPITTEIFRGEIFTELVTGNHTQGEAQVCFEVELVAGQQYRINGINFEILSTISGINNFWYYQKSGSCINVYFCQPNEGVETTAIRNVVIQVEGIVCRKDWLKWKNSSENCILVEIACLCNGSGKAWINDIEYNYCTNKITGNLKGRYE